MHSRSKVLDLESGLVMVVTDLHGNLQDYELVMQTFEKLKDKGEAGHLVITGDVVHGYPQYEDRSKDILVDLIERGANTPDSDIQVLLGNHDMVHIYHIVLRKVPLEFTHGFEEAIANDRQKFIDFFMSMPFAVRTAGGVLLNHTGASAIIGSGEEGRYGVTFDYLASWPHEDILQEVSRIAEAKDYPSHTDSFNPAIGQIFNLTHRGKFLWEFLMNKNEGSYGEEYLRLIPSFLEWMGVGHETPLTVMVNGHIGVPEGARVSSEHQLRISSSYGARSDADKAYLVFDASEKYAGAEDLISQCRKLHAPLL